MCTAFPNSDYYGSSAPHWQCRRATRLPLAADGLGGCQYGSHVHDSPVCMVRYPAIPLQLRHHYAADIHDGLPFGDIHRVGSWPCNITATHCNPAHIHQVGAGGSLLRGFKLRIHFRYTFHARLLDPQYLIVLLRPSVVRTAPTLIGVPRVGLSPACTQLLRQSDRDGLSPPHG